MTLPKWSRLLQVQVFFLLSLALMPIGLIAVYQTSQISLETERTAELALLALTEQAAGDEQLIIERAFGSAKMLGVIATGVLETKDECRVKLGEFIDNEPKFSAVAIIPLSGGVPCTSAAIDTDLSEDEIPQNARENPRSRIRVVDSTTLTGRSAVIVSQPYYDDDQLAGFVRIAMPHFQIMADPTTLSSAGLVNLMTFNSAGVVLTSHLGMDVAIDHLPAGLALETIKVSKPYSFSGKDREGNDRLFTIAPVKGSPFTIMGVWNVQSPIVSSLDSSLPPATFPVLMWLASLAVAMLALHTLVLRHVNKLRQNISKFKQTRTVAPPIDRVSMPSELAEVSDNFHEMAHSILQEEAQMEDLVRDKSVLVKEVHHRVKNNLQMISSIMNMQIGTAEHEETRDALERLQRRVLSLATIHRDLYQSQAQGRVDATQLMSEIVEKSIEAVAPDKGEVDLTSSYDPLLLFPDQAVPLSLFVSEAVTNALKYINFNTETPPKMSVHLTHDAGAVTLRMTNDIGLLEGDMESTGLGAQLMSGFVIQLGGHLEKSEKNGQYCLELSFTAAEFSPDAVDF